FSFYFTVHPPHADLHSFLHDALPIYRIKRLALVALDVFFRGPIVRLESVEVGTPFQVVTQLVGERFPGFLAPVEVAQPGKARERDRKSTRLNSSHVKISYAVFCLKKK